MTKKIRYLAGLLTLSLLLLLSILSPASPFNISAAEIPKEKVGAAARALEAQAGNADGILILGVVLFIFIAVPILLRYRILRSAP
jgi:hypothetical protein